MEPTRRATPASVEAYIAAQPEAARARLRAMRRIIRTAEPRVEEGISYQIPAFRLDGRYLVYIAAFKAHTGMYPVPKGDAAFAAAAAPYRSGKSTLRFPLDEPLPVALIGAVLRFRTRESSAPATGGTRARGKAASRTAAASRARVATR